MNMLRNNRYTFWDVFYTLLSFCITIDMIVEVIMIAVKFVTMVNEIIEGLKNNE